MNSDSLCSVAAKSNDRISKKSLAVMLKALYGDSQHLESTHPTERPTDDHFWKTYAPVGQYLLLIFSPGAYRSGFPYEQGAQDIFSGAFWVGVGTPTIAGEDVVLGLLCKAQDCWSMRLSFSFFYHVPLSSWAISQALSPGQTKMNSATQFTQKKE